MIGLLHEAQEDPNLISDNAGTPYEWFVCKMCVVLPT